MRKTTLCVKRYLLPLVLMFVGVVTTYAQDFTCNKLTYTVLTDNTCETKQGARNLLSITAGNTVGDHLEFPEIVADSEENTYTVTALGDYSFAGTQLVSVNLPNSVTTIGKSAFEGCYLLPSVSIPDGVTSIGERAFADCLVLTSVEIPSSVTSIGEQAFYGCVQLTSVSVDNTTPPEISDNTFPSTRYLLAKLYVPLSAVEAYKAATGWKNFQNIIGVDETVAGVTEVAGEVTDGAVAVEDGVICVNSNGPVQIVALSGVTLYGGRGNVSVNVAPGIYMVIIGNKVMKVAVK